MSVSDHDSDRPSFAPAGAGSSALNSPAVRRVAAKILAVFQSQVDALPSRDRQLLRHLNSLSPEASEESRLQAIAWVADNHRRPIHPNRWTYIADEVLEELRRRGLERDDPAGEALGAAAWLAQGSMREGTPDYPHVPIAAIPPLFKSRLADAYASDLFGPDWRRSTASARERQAHASMEEDFIRAQRLRRASRYTEVEVEIRRRAIETRAEELTEAQREVFLLVERDGLTPSEAAEHLRIRPAAARNRLKRARDRLSC